jgi:hypothetical protein
MKRKLPAALALVGLLVALPLSQAGAVVPEASRTTSPVTLVTDPSVVVGSSTLTRTAGGISFTLETSGLEPGHAVTIWWMATNPDGGTAVLYAAGHVVGGTGTAIFAGYLAVGASEGWVMGDDKTLEDALAATVTLVVRDHGPGRADILDDQIRTFGACNPVCADLQTSVHPPS